MGDLIVNRVRRWPADGVVVVAGLVGGLFLRVWLLFPPTGALDGDEAAWGLMARHVLRGELPALFWGQNYGGTQETFLTAPLIGAFGNTAAAVRAVPIALSAFAAFLVWRIGRRLIGEPQASFAAVIFWSWPLYVVWKSTRAHGFYGSSLVLGLLVVLFALRIRDRPSTLHLAAFGGCIGCGLWASPATGVLSVPALVWLVWRRPSVLRRWWLTVAAAAVGALPWLLANLRHHWYSLHNTTPQTSALAHLHNLAVATFPTALGLRLPFSLDWLGGGIFGAAAYALILVGLAWASSDGAVGSSSSCSRC
jgi:Dolichyl-phosphate-mannose-protein mannosyltransferase